MVIFYYKERSVNVSFNKIPLIGNEHSDETRNIINLMVQVINNRGIEILSESSFLSWLEENGLSHQGEWDESKEYDRLDVVLYEGSSYTSKKPTPAGIDILDEEYWVLTGNYNSQVESYRQEVIGLQEEITSEVNDITSEVNDIKDKQYVSIDLFGAVGDGVTDDTIAIQNSIDYAIETGKPLQGTTKTYKIHRLSLPENKYFLSSTNFVLRGDDTGNVYSIDVQENSEVDTLNIKVPSGATNERIVRVQSNTYIDSINIIAESNLSTGNDLLDSAVYISGDNITVNNIYTDLCESSVIVLQSTNVNLGDLKLMRSVRGLYVRESRHIEVSKIITRDAPINDEWGAGKNGVLIEESEDIYFDVAYIADSAEHGIRIGGVRNEKYKQRSIHFGEVITRRTKGCGFKVFSGALSGEPYVISNISIDSLTVIDACYKMPPIRNRDGLHLSAVNKVSINDLRVITSDSNISSYFGMYVSGVNDLNIGRVFIDKSINVGAMFEKDYGQVNKIYIDNFTCIGVGNEMINVNHSGEVMRDFYIRNIWGREWGLNYPAIKLELSLVYQPLLLQGYVRVDGNRRAFESIPSTHANIINKVETV